jgi:Fe-S-cluster containining protein
MKSSFVHECLIEDFRKIDADITEAIGERPVTCRKGCAGCCYQLIEISIAEGILLSHWVAARDDARPWIRRLFRAARDQTGPTVTVASHFDRAIPCVFLAPDRVCAVYDHRPLVCRYLVVRSPAENCAPGAANPTVQSYNFSRKIFESLVEFDLLVVRDNPQFGPVATAPIPLMVLWALHKSTTGADHRYIEKFLRRLPTPLEWTRQRLNEVRKEKHHG